MSIVKKIKWLLNSLSFLILSVVLIFIFCNYLVLSLPYNSYSIENLPASGCALLLGTSPFNRKGGENEFFKKRIDSAVFLYKNHKIKKIIASGDGRNREPQVMKKNLMENGIPEDDILLDYKGFDTFNSVFRAKSIFGCDSFVIISQNFHNKRALFLANYLNINAEGYDSEDVGGYTGQSVKARELFARVKAVSDIIYYNIKNKN